MKILNLILVLLIAIGLSSCSTTGGRGGGYVDIFQPSKNAKVYKPSKTIVIKDKNDIPTQLGKVSGRDWDLQGGVLDGQKLDGSWGSNDEDQEPVLRIEMDGLKIKNGFIYTYEGIAVHAEDVWLDHLVFPKSGEENITANQGTKNLTIKNCQFGKGQDKILQLNSPAGSTLIESNVFDGGINGVRFGLSKYDTKGTGTARKNQFYRTETAYQVTGSERTLNVEADTEKYENVSQRYKSVDGGKINVK